LVERLFGSATFLFLYCACGIVSGLVSVAWHPNLNSAGASGSIFGLYGALLTVLIRADASIPRSVVLPLRYSALVFTIYSLVAGFVHPGVDIAAHFGGLGAGFILGMVLARRLTISDTPASRVSTIGAGALASAALLCVGILFANQAASSMQGEGQFWRTQHWIERNERTALDHWHNINEQLRRNKLDDTGYAELLGRQVLPIWQEAERRIQTVQLDETSANFHALEYLRAARPNSPEGIGSH
jgi:rhomboid protease GluP